MVKKVGKSKFNFNGKSIMLTYKTHIAQESIIEKFQEFNCRIKATHESSDKEVQYDHTHILIYFITKTHIRDCRKFDIGDIHPNIKPIKTKDHFKNTIEYLDKQNKAFLNTLTGNEYMFLGSVRDIIQSFSSWSQVINCSEIEHEVKRYMNWARECFNCRPKVNMTKDIKLRKFQEDIIERLKIQNDRQILWVYDEIGGRGKSVLANYLIDRGAFFSDSGKLCDLAYAYNNESTVIFDLPRTTKDTDGKDWTPYRAMECFKNGRLFSSKYQSNLKRFKSCKIVVFANFLPDKSKLSRDRWDVLDLSDYDVQEVVPESLNISERLQKLRIKRRKRKLGFRSNRTRSPIRKKARVDILSKELGGTQFFDDGCESSLPKKTTIYEGDE